MRLYIAEKPDVAKAIRAAVDPAATSKDGYFECKNGDCITWCFGHMLRLLDPHEYDKKFEKWSLEDLPFSHIPWRKIVIDDKKKQVKTIGSLLHLAKEVVHAGDPDEEGQLLVDELLQYFKYSGNCKRLLINDNNIDVVQKALTQMKDNQQFKGLSQAAEARSVSDQLYGYNLTRAYTLKAQQKGYQGVLSVGRVQTPVLGLVVRRFIINKSHTPSYYYVIAAQIEVANCEFWAGYKPAENDPLEDNKIVDADFANKVVAAVKNQPAKIISAQTTHKKESPILPYNLLKLQMDCSRKFGYKPDETKQITQDLREKYKLITYNRSDCQYLSDEQHADAEHILAAIRENSDALARATAVADPALKSRAFNSKKVTAHHAIIPTKARYSIEQLTEQQRNVYMLVARSYIAQFFANTEFDETLLEIEINNYIFLSKSKQITNIGWKSLYKNDKNNEELEEDSSNSLDLRNIKTNSVGVCIDATAEKKQTAPPALYTIASLLSDLTRVSKYIKDEKIRQLLLDKDKDKAGEHGGIGTPATRDVIIKNLFDKGFILEEKGKIIPTKIGIDFYNILPDDCKYPDMTALWHEKQKEIIGGSMDVTSFVTQLMSYIETTVEKVKSTGLNGLNIKTHNCPACKGILRRIKGSKGVFWGCSNYKNGCKTTYQDKAGKPELVAQNQNQSKASRGKPTKTRAFFKL